MSLKTESKNDPNELSPLEAVIQIVLRFLQTNFGVLGALEFRIDDIRYYSRSNAWKVLLTRTIDSLAIRYELTIDLVRQRPARFRRIT